MDEQVANRDPRAGYGGDMPAEDAPVRRSSDMEAEEGENNNEQPYWGMGGQPDGGDEDEERDEVEEDEEDEGDERNGEDEGEEDVVAEYETVPSDETDFRGDTPL